MIPVGDHAHLRLHEELGRGAFGVVYRADLVTPDGLLTRVAVKVIQAEHGDVGQIAARQRDEARLLAQLHHDHIVLVYDLIEHQGRPLVIMELVDGATIEALVRARGPLPPRCALTIAGSVASALDVAYNSLSPVTGRPLRAIHRDIKPGNIMLGVTGSVKVLDFGIAMADFERDAHTRTGLPGTLPFMAPELLLEAALSPAVDVYALGLSLYRMLTGLDVERMPLAQSRFQPRLDEVLGRARSMLGAYPHAADVVDLLGATLSWRPDQRPSAQVLSQSLLTLADLDRTESLASFAARVIPALPRAPARPRDDAARSEPPKGEITAATVVVPPKAVLADRRSPAAATVGGDSLIAATGRPRKALMLSGFGLAAVGVVAWVTSPSGSSILPEPGPLQIPAPSTSAEVADEVSPAPTIATDPAAADLAVAPAPSAEGAPAALPSSKVAGNVRDVTATSRPSVKTSGDRVPEVAWQTNGTCVSDQVPVTLSTEPAGGVFRIPGLPARVAPATLCAVEGKVLQPSVEFSGVTEAVTGFKASGLAAPTRTWLRDEHMWVTSTNTAP